MGCLPSQEHRNEWKVLYWIDAELNQQNVLESEKMQLETRQQSYNVSESSSFDASMRGKKHAAVCDSNGSTIT
jgi:hypothetical protein